MMINNSTVDAKELGQFQFETDCPLLSHRPVSAPLGVTTTPKRHWQISVREAASCNYGTICSMRPIGGQLIAQKCDVI